MIRHFFCSILFTLWTSFLAHASNTPFLPQSFFFNYDPPAQPVPIPITAQCETIHITWERSIATGPNPTAPYFLQIYTSTFIFPFVVAAGSGLSFDWAVPFAPGTQYQICMFDKNGNTGGCQATYTVVPSTVTPPSCQNVTFPLGPLAVEASVANGPLSQFGWVDQCTDIAVSPKNGTPPYTITIAPALHPPFNITMNGMESMNWTVSLSWASPFFISVVDFMGNSWANGPLHSGNGATGCLAEAGVSPLTGLEPALAVGSGIGGLVIGALAGIGAAYAFMQHRLRKKKRGHFINISSGSPAPGSPAAIFHQLDSNLHPRYSAVPSGHYHDSSVSSSNPLIDPATLLKQMTYDGSAHYEVEPFMFPTEDGRRDSSSHQRPSFHESTLTSPRGSQAGSIGQNQVYVVHHDGGRAPVTVYHADGTEVVELPPRYLGTGNRGVRKTGDEELIGGSNRRSDAPHSVVVGEPTFARHSREAESVSKTQITPTAGPSTSR